MTSTDPHYRNSDYTKSDALKGVINEQFLNDNKLDTIGRKNLKELLEKNGDMKELLKETKIKEVDINDYIYYRDSLKLEDLIKIARHYGISTCKLLTGEEYDPNN